MICRAEHDYTTCYASRESQVAARKIQIRDYRLVKNEPIVKQLVPYQDQTLQSDNLIQLVYLATLTLSIFKYIYMCVLFGMSDVSQMV